MCIKLKISNFPEYDIYTSIQVYFAVYVYYNGNSEFIKHSENRDQN